MPSRRRSCTCRGKATGGSFVATACRPRRATWATGGALSVPASDTVRTGPADGLLLLAGGSATADATSPLKSAELYGFATIKTDKSDYAPGTTVTITGSGWQPGEWVALMLNESPDLDEHPLLAVQADDTGNIVSTEFSPDAARRQHPVLSDRDRSRTRRRRRRLPMGT